MKRFLIFAVCIILCAGCKRGEEEVTEAETHIHEQESTEEKIVVYDFDLAKEKGDFVGMNKAMAENADFDFTHGGIMESYDYSYPKNGAEAAGKVYILKLPLSLPVEEREKIADSQTVEDREYIVLDMRGLPDPDMEIRDSYRCMSVTERGCVIDILLEYEKKSPTEWERSKISMENEWNLHNLAYVAGYKVERSKHVNLNNADE